MGKDQLYFFLSVAVLLYAGGFLWVETSNTITEIDILMSLPYANIGENLFSTVYEKLINFQVNSLDLDFSKIDKEISNIQNY
jgi:hypothetical protein